MKTKPQERKEEKEEKRGVGMIAKERRLGLM